MTFLGTVYGENRGFFFYNYLLTHTNIQREEENGFQSELVKGEKKRKFHGRRKEKKAAVHGEIVIFVAAEGTKCKHKTVLNSTIQFNYILE